MGKNGHPSAVTFEELSPTVQALDAPYAEAIRVAARKLRERQSKEGE